DPLGRDGLREAEAAGRDGGLHGPRHEDERPYAEQWRGEGADQARHAEDGGNREDHLLQVPSDRAGQHAHQKEVPEKVKVMFVVAFWRLEAAALGSVAWKQSVSDAPAASSRGVEEETRFEPKAVPVPLSADPPQVT